MVACVVLDSVICDSLDLLYIFVVVFLVLNLFSSVLANRLVGKSFSEMTYFVLSGTFVN